MTDSRLRSGMFGALALALAGLAALPARADASLCRGVEGIGPACAVLEQHCLPYLDDPASLSPADVAPVPERFRRYFEGPLTEYVLGYRETGWPNTLVIYMAAEPACEIVTFGLDYADLLPAYHEWRAGPGAAFASTGEFEPRSKISMARAYAATFLAAPRSDGRVTEITFNWNLNFEGLTRLRVSYQPLREHTRDMMQAEMD